MSVQSMSPIYLGGNSTSSAVGDGCRLALLGSISKTCDSALELKYSKMSHCSETRSNSDEVLKRGRGWAEGLCTSVS